MVDLGRKQVLDDGGAWWNSTNGHNGIDLNSSNELVKYVLAFSEGLLVRSRDVSPFGG